MKLRKRNFAGVMLCMLTSVDALAFDSTAMLPEGVRRFYVRSVATQFDKQTTSTGGKQSLAAPLQRDVTFEDFVNNRQGLDKTQLQSFLDVYGFDNASAVGTIKADMKAAVNVFAPTFAVGITDRFNFGVVVPIYSARSSVNMAFQPNQNARDFVNKLSSPEVGLRSRATEAVDSLNSVVAKFNQSLVDNGYEELDDWEDTGLGDVYFKAKYLTVKKAADFFSMSNHGGVRAPTGRTDDPDILNDIPFGDGTWDVYAGFNMDATIWGPFYFNNNVEYTYQLPASRSVRMKTNAEPLAVPKRRVEYKLGDTVAAEGSLVADTRFGLLSGVGYRFFKKFEDNYKTEEETALLFEDGSAQEKHSVEYLLGYSSVLPYRHGTMPVPFEASLEYSRAFLSWNAPDGDLYALNLKLFF